MSAVTLQSIITCPVCGPSETETMLVDACLYFYECQGRGALPTPNSSNCGVFCSYGTVPCPPK
ncbi:MAG: GDCCVxC domain-containing (seleno)protein [Acidithiobacillus sp.]|nr:GDCCVxC domain-containing (seleno)protein [Acidithiobacillus sp.]